MVKMWRTDSKVAPLAELITTSEIFKATNIFIFHHFTFYGHTAVISFRVYLLVTPNASVLVGVDTGRPLDWPKLISAFAR